MTVDGRELSDPRGNMVPMPELTDRDRQMLDFEGQWWKYAGLKEQAIREKFDMSATRYAQCLNALLDNPAALAHDPMTVKRLRRIRAARRPKGARGMTVNRLT